MRIAQIQNNKVVNVIEADSVWSSNGSDSFIESDVAGIGWELVNGELQAPVPPPVDPIELAQAWVAKFFDAVQLLKMFQWVAGGKKSAKLTAVLIWEETISAESVAGATTFSDAPFTFREVATEVLTTAS